MDTKSLINAQLGMARLLCDWSVANTNEVTDTSIALWKTAWSEYHLDLLERPHLEERYKEEVDHTMANNMKAYRTSHNLGLVSSFLFVR